MADADGPLTSMRYSLPAGNLETSQVWLDDGHSLACGIVRTLAVPLEAHTLRTARDELPSVAVATSPLSASDDGVRTRKCRLRSAPAVVARSISTTAAPASSGIITKSRKAWLTSLGTSLRWN